MDAGHHREALALVEDLVSLADTIGEGETRPELVRLHGALAARAGDPGAEHRLIQALVAARGKGLRWWELRAARDLARLRRDQGRVAEARGLLAPVYASFTEGFAFPDLVEAKALLEDLGAAPADGAERRREQARTPSGPDQLREPVPGR